LQAKMNHGEENEESAQVRTLQNAGY